MSSVKRNDPLCTALETSILFYSSNFQSIVHLRLVILNTGDAGFHAICKHHPSHPKLATTFRKQNYSTLIILNLYRLHYNKLVLHVYKKACMVEFSNFTGCDETPCILLHTCALTWAILTLFDSLLKNDVSNPCKN